MGPKFIDAANVSWEGSGGHVTHGQASSPGMNAALPKAHGRWLGRVHSDVLGKTWTIRVIWAITM